MRSLLFPILCPSYPSSTYAPLLSSGLSDHIIGIKKKTLTNIKYVKGPFNNYVDKMRGKGVKKCLFFPRSVYKNYPRRGGGIILST